MENSQRYKDIRQGRKIRVDKRHSSSSAPEDQCPTEHVLSGFLSDHAVVLWGSGSQARSLWPEASFEGSPSGPRSAQLALKLPF
jgi:hypothetical protein